MVFANIQSIEKQRRIKCNAALKQIGNALLNYAGDPDGFIILTESSKTDTAVNGNIDIDSDSDSITGELFKESQSNSEQTPPENSGMR